jgi:hypothetical protein
MNQLQNIRARIKKSPPANKAKQHMHGKCEHPCLESACILGVMHKAVVKQPQKANENK